MSLVATDIKQFLSIKIKPRDDNVFDQYSRMFMMKIFLITSMICGISWYGDKFNCIVPESMASFEDFPKFVGSTCWIQGVYVYRDLRIRNDDVAYFGITKDIDMDGHLENKNKDLCKTFDRLNNQWNEHCKPLQKTFFQQYQYMPFLLGALALLFYVPYMLHKVANHDMIKLKEEIEKEKPDAPAIFKAFFKNRKRRPVNAARLTSRHAMILLVKVCYVGVNVLSLMALNGVLNGYFVGFGHKWWEWSKQDNTMQFDYMGSREFPKPANEVLPPFGYCEIYSSAKDIKESHVNKHKVICELSQHVLYQYALVLLWMLLIVGIIVSVIGLLVAIIKMLAGVLGARKLGEQPQTRKIYERLIHREIDYLEFLRQQNIVIYGEIMALLTDTDIPNGGLHNEKKHPEKNPLIDERYGDGIPLKRSIAPYHYE